LKRPIYLSAFLLLSFVLWTLFVQWIDLASIGPQDSIVGFSTINGFFHRLTGVHLFLYQLTDWLSLIPLVFVLGFALLGLVQWFQRRSLFMVDRSLFILGGFYILVFLIFIFFEIYVINYRPILINGCLEASYPSSTTLLFLCVMPTAVMQLKHRLQNHCKVQCLSLLTLFTAVIVALRAISGVHWITDIIGGILLSTGLVTLYSYLIQKADL
jgi:undecaprenyl-diphosphatase